MKKFAITIVVAAIFAVNGCSLFSSGGGGGSSNPEVNAAISAAEAAVKKANSVDGLWRDTSSKFLKNAKAAAAKGDDATALKLAKKAKFEAEMGFKQAMSQEKAGPWLF